MKPCDTEMGPFFQALDFLSPYFSGTFSSWEASYTQKDSSNLYQYSRNNRYHNQQLDRLMDAVQIAIIFLPLW